MVVRVESCIIYYCNEARVGNALCDHPLDNGGAGRGARPK